MRRIKRGYRWSSGNTVTQGYLFALIYDRSCDSIINEDNKPDGWPLTRWRSGTRLWWYTTYFCDSILQDEIKSGRTHWKGMWWYCEARITHNSLIMSVYVRKGEGVPGIWEFLLWSTGDGRSFALTCSCAILLIWPMRRGCSPLRDVSSIEWDDENETLGRLLIRYRGGNRFQYYTNWQRVSMKRWERAGGWLLRQHEGGSGCQ